MLYNLHNFIISCSAVIIFFLMCLNVAHGSLGSSSQDHKPSASAMATTPNLSSKIESININTADAVTLQKIKWMSKKKAQAIIEYRDKNGPFKTTDDLLKVNCRGIHKKWLDKVSKLLVI